MTRVVVPDTNLGVLVGASAIVIATSALAQPGVSRPFQLVPVEQNTTDASPLFQCQGFEPIDLRHPIDFERVYRVTPTPAIGIQPLETLGTPGDGLFARVSGGLIITFPRSTYERVGDSTVATLPPGAIFHIASHTPSRVDAVNVPTFAPDPFSPSPDLPPLPSANRRLALARSPVPTTRLVDHAPEAETPARENLWSNDTYRAARISSLIALATQNP
ncbi:MAG: hypothetical protein AB7Q00_01165 [Phycisphaerales bacterium]